MSHLFDPQMCNLADYDCFSQVVFESIEDYKRMKQDSWYKEHLFNDHPKFADTKRSQFLLSSSSSWLIASRMTIGWIEDFIRDGQVVQESSF